MINPIERAYNAFVTFLEALPQPIYAFLFLCFALFVITAIVRLILK